MRGYGWVGLVAVLWSCVGGTGEEAVDARETLQRDGIPDVLVFADSRGTDVGPEWTELVWDADVEGWSLDLAEPCPAGKGCFGDPCQSGEDCWSDLCLTHLGDGVCSQTCIEECPVGWLCRELKDGGPDSRFACVSPFALLCLPCHDNQDCRRTGSEVPCVLYPGEGAFCGASCGPGDSCPAGFGCETVETVAGTTVKQCIHSGGACPCSELAASLGLSTFCQQSNEHGTCVGIRGCGSQGLGDCQARIPQAESCNGVDDDCDGKTDEETCDDGNPCTKDSCVPGPGCVNDKLTGTPCDDGNACTFGDLCADGACAATLLVCDDGNPCTDNLCMEDSGCHYPANQSACSDNDPCTQGDVCVDKGCVAGPRVDCDDSNPCTNDSCLESGGCLHVPNTNACDDGNKCTTGDQCVNGLCLPKGSTQCEDGNPCTVNACDPVDGCVYPFHSDGCDDGDPCTVGDYCSLGYCLPGQPKSCDDANPCTNEVCIPGSGCQWTPNTKPCDDKNPCTVTDVCEEGFCVGYGLKNCNDQNPCTDDNCEPMVGCRNVPNTAACNDGNACTMGDFCGEGQCHPGPQSLVCVDGNACTKDTCQPETGCVFVSLSQIPCTDGNACTDGDVCQGGQCQSGALLNCDDNNPCTNDSCDPQAGCVNVPNTLACDDGNACTLGDRCQGGSCVPGGTALVCQDNNACTEDTCQPLVGCVFTKLTGTDCTDGNACTLGDICSNGVCTPNATLQCDDGKTCTADSCEPASGCLHQPLSGISCSDGDACTLGDLCQGGLCIPGTGTPDCNDGNECTADSCEPTVGCVNQKLTGTTCNDSNACTINDRCTSGVCGSTQTLPCGDGNLCTDDSCDPDLGCQYVNNSNPCNDSNACTQVDVCSEGGCVGTSPVTCNDAKSCTDDSCDPVSGCRYVPNDANLCTDGNLCTLGDRCSGGQCVHDSLLSCDDGNACTVNSCVPATGCKTVNVQDGTGCSDNNVCTTVDTCQAGKCVGAQPLNCSDGKQCTFDECHTVTGCYNPKVPDFMQCNDFNLCTVGDHCRDGECVKTSDLPCDDGNDCTRNLCQPATGCDFSQPTVFCCGNGILETPYEECDDGNRVSGDGCEADCKLPPCPWWNYEQLFCNGDCSQAGGTNCDKADADLLCKLKTCRCNAVALSFQIKQVRSGPGFSCPGSGIYVGTQPLYCVNVPIWHTPQLMGVDFGTVVTDVVCSN